LGAPAGSDDREASLSIIRVIGPVSFHYMLR